MTTPTAARPQPLPDFTSQLVALEPLLFKVACKLCQRPDDARDLVQDTFERALRAGASPNPNLKAWLLSILQHRFIDLWRKRSHQHQAGAIETLPAEPPAQVEETPTWAELDEARVRAAVDRLHPNYREVFVLHALEGHAYVDVARKIGIPKATVGTRLFRARQRLRVILEADLWRAGGAGDLSLAKRRVLAQPRPAQRRGRAASTARCA